MIFNIMEHIETHYVAPVAKIRAFDEEGILCISPGSEINASRSDYESAEDQEW